MGGALTLPHSHPASRRAPPTSPSSSSSPPRTPATASKMSSSCCKHSTTGEPGLGAAPLEEGACPEPGGRLVGVEARVILCYLVSWRPAWATYQTSSPIVWRRKLRYTLFMASETLSAVISLYHGPCGAHTAHLIPFSSCGAGSLLVSPTPSSWLAPTNPLPASHM